MNEAFGETLLGMLGLGGFTLVSFVIAKLIHRHDDKRDNGGHHGGHEGIEPPLPFREVGSK